MLYILNKSQKFIFLMLFLGCAAQGPTLGGPEDLIGPVILNVFPNNGTVGLQELNKIEIMFNELINPISVPAAIRINPYIEYSIKTRGKKVTIILKESLLAENNIYRISISKTIRDYRGNGMKTPLNIVYSSGEKIPQKFISGNFINLNLDSFYSAALYHYPVSDSSSPLLTVEVDNNGSFLFNYLESGNYVIAGLEAKITDIKKQVRLNRYGIINDSYLNLNDAPFLEKIKIYIDDPIEQISIQSIDIKNRCFGRIKLSNGELENYIIPWKDNKNKTPFETGDTIHISLERKNQLEEYITPEFKFILPEKNDTTPPIIMYNEINGSNLDITFSEPIQKWKNIDELKNIKFSDYTILGFSDSDTVNLKYNFLDPMRIRILGLDTINQVEIFNDNIKDIYENILADSVTVFPISKSNEEVLNEGLGSIMGKITYTGNEKIVLNIENIKSKLNYYTMMKNNQYTFDNLPSGQYILWAYESLNIIDQNKYFSGTWSPYKRASKFSVFPDTVEVRARWVIDGLSLEIN